MTPDGSPIETRRKAASPGLDRAGLRLTAILACAVALMGAGIPPDQPEPFLDKHPGALWRVVHDLCVSDRRLLGLPAPCLAVSLGGGWAVVKDTGHRTQILLVPTQRISGIESPALLAHGAPNYWADAWDARRYFFRLVGHPVPRGDFGMVINSRFGRTQDQLHIHIDCLAPQVARAIREAAPNLGATWRPIAEPLSEETFEARRLDGDSLERNPFKLLAKGDPAARADMGQYALGIVGEVFPDGRPGFVLLAHRADLQRGDRGVGEALLDHRCLVLRPDAAAGATPPASYSRKAFKPANAYELRWKPL
jgi:CDP-diacylglycerol pyrophosphatase